MINANMVIEIFMNFISQFWLFIIGFFVIVIGINYFTRKTNKPYHYIKSKYLLDKYESQFFVILRDSIRGMNLEVFPKVRMSDFMHVDYSLETTLRISEKNRIHSKHVDFLICSSGYFNPVMVIELDGASHDKEDRKKTDLFKDEATKIAGIPMLRIRIQKNYNSAEIIQQIQSMLQEVN